MYLHCLPRLEIIDSQNENTKIGLIDCEVETKDKILDRKVANSLGIDFGKH